MLLKIGQQVERMKATHPQFDAVIAGDWLACWLGTVRPFSQEYQIRITMVRPYFIEAGQILSRRPRVEVLSPALEHRADGYIPHLYKNDNNPDIPSLCLYYPDADEWDWSDFIAETTVLWAIKWLACYEGWRATGEWTGGGRPHDIQKEKQECLPSTQSQKSALRALDIQEGFLWIGRRIGTFASYPLMAAALKESFQPLSWQNWSEDTSTIVRYPNTSILSPGRQQVEFSVWALQQG